MDKILVKFKIDTKMAIEVDETNKSIEDTMQSEISNYPKQVKFKNTGSQYEIFDSEGIAYQQESFRTMLEE